MTTIATIATRHRATIPTVAERATAMRTEDTIVPRTSPTVHMAVPVPPLATTHTPGHTIAAHMPTVPPEVLLCARPTTLTPAVTRTADESTLPTVQQEDFMLKRTENLLQGAIARPITAPSEGYEPARERAPSAGTRSTVRVPW